MKITDKKNFKFTEGFLSEDLPLGVTEDQLEDLGNNVEVAEDLDFPVDKEDEPAPLLTDVMIDLETLSTRPDATIISVAAIMFDLRTGKTGPAFVRNINISSNVKAGRRFDPDTLAWWVDDNGAQFARWCQIEAKIDLNHGLKDLIAFIKENTTDLKSFQVWGNSNRFDLGILENALLALGFETPWHFRGERDVRTLASLKPEVKREAQDEWKSRGYNLHDPLVDCRLQISYCTAIYNALVPKKEPVNDLDFTVDSPEQVKAGLYAK